MVIVRVAVWLIAPVPLVEAVTVTVLAPGGVPGLPGFPPLLLLPHDGRLAASARRANMPKRRELRRADFLRAAMRKIIPRQGSSSA